MKYLFLLVLVCGLVCGCVTDESLTVTTRTLGLDISQGASGMYYMRLGFSTTQWHQNPVSTNALFAAPVYSSVDVNSRGLSTDIAEDFAVGDGVKAIDNSTHASPAKLGALQRQRK